MIFLVDPGHGGDDPGCSGNGVVEKAVNLSVAQALRQAVVNQSVEVRLTRDSDLGLTLAQRAQDKGCAFALALHCDTAPNPATGHFRTYAKGDDAMGMAVAARIAAWCPDDLGPQHAVVTVAQPNDWTHRAYNVLRHHSCPAALVEMGFLSNPAHAQFLTSPRGRLAVVCSLMAGLAKAWSMTDQGLTV